MGLASSAAGIHFRMDRINQGLLAHRVDDARRPQDGQAADDAQARVEGLPGQALTLGDGQGQAQAARIAALLASLLQGFGNHAARHGVDGPIADGTGQAGLGHAADADAADNGQAGRRLFDGPVDEHAVSDIRVIATVLADGARRRLGTERDVFRDELEDRPLRRLQGYGFDAAPGQDHDGRRLGRRGRTGPGRIAAAHFLPFFDRK